MSIQQGWGEEWSSPGGHNDSYVAAAIQAYEAGLDPFSCYVFNTLLRVLDQYVGHNIEGAIDMDALRVVYRALQDVADQLGYGDIKLGVTQEPASG